MRSVRLTLALAAALGASTLGGCAYFAPTPTLMPGIAEAQINDDLPVPQGFELVRDKTWRHERSAYRRLRLTYHREKYLSKERVVEFIRAQFPLRGWEVKFVYGLETPQLILHKGSEECRVTISEDFGDAFTEFMVEVEPRTTPDGALVATDPSFPSTTGTAAETNPATGDIAPTTTEVDTSK